jgi:uncharacterized glyoxalase superfamily protein PhnB
MATVTDSALIAKTMVPTLTVDDIQKSVAFYEGLGFAVAERWEDNGVLQGVMLKAGELQIGLSQDDWKKGRDRQKGIGMRVYIETTQNIDQLATRAKAAGVTLEKDPYDTPWKTRVFEVTDPTGFKLTIGSESPESAQ